MVTLVVAALGALFALIAVHRAWSAWPPAATLMRSLAVTALTLLVGAWWRTTGAMTIVELAVMSIGAALLLIALGELTPQERQLAVSIIRRSQPFTSSTRRLF